MRTPSAPEFNAIVNAAAEGIARIVEVSTHGLSGEVIIKSASGKVSWNSIFSVDQATGELSAHIPYRDSTAARTFFANLSRALREAKKG